MIPYPVLFDLNQPDYRLHQVPALSQMWLHYQVPSMYLTYSRQILLSSHLHTVRLHELFYLQSNIQVYSSADNPSHY